MFFQYIISSCLYNSQIIKDTIGKTITVNKIPNAFKDHFDIVELTMLCIVSFGVGRLYEMFLNRDKSDWFFFNLYFSSNLDKSVSFVV